MPGPRPVAPRDRFWKYVEKTDGCWLWTGATSSGYGVLNSYSGPMIYVHRLSYEMHVGAIPDGAQVCHSCDVRPCVRPDHLFAGSFNDNMLDATVKGRMNRGSKNGRAKLDEVSVMLIGAAINAGVSDRELGERFNVCQGTIKGIRLRRTWRHVNW